MIYTIMVQDCPATRWKLLDQDWLSCKFTGALRGYEERSSQDAKWIELYFEGTLVQYLFVKMILFGRATIMRGWHVDFIEKMRKEEP